MPPERRGGGAPEGFCSTSRLLNLNLAISGVPPLPSHMPQGNRGCVRRGLLPGRRGGWGRIRHARPPGRIFFPARRAWYLYSSLFSGPALANSLRFPFFSGKQRLFAGGQFPFADAGDADRWAARLNEWQDIDAIIRHDLAEKGELQAERYLIADNAQRRQLSPLQMARSAQRLKELVVLQKRGKIRECDQGSIHRETRSQVGQMLGIGGREVSRLLRVLRAPPEVQDALDAGRLTIMEANDVTSLGAKDQKAIARAIQQGQAPKTVVAKFIEKETLRKKGVKPFFRGLLKDVSEARGELAGRVPEIRVDLSDCDQIIGELRLGEGFFRELIDHVEASKATMEAAWEDKSERMSKLVGAE